MCCRDSEGGANNRTATQPAQLKIPEVEGASLEAPRDPPASAHKGELLPVHLHLVATLYFWRADGIGPTLA